LIPFVQKNMTEYFGMLIAATWLLENEWSKM
jgi:hypothetical protein